MSDTVKLIIEIPQAMYESVQNGTYCGTLFEELKNGVPLDEVKNKILGYNVRQHVEIIRREGTPTYNIQCRNYGEYRDRNGKVIKRTCTVGMDMCYCSKNCAYATNNVCSLKG